MHQDPTRRGRAATACCLVSRYLPSAILGDDVAVETLRNPMVWAGLLLTGLTILVVAVGRADDQPTLLDSAVLTGTITGVSDAAVDDGDLRTVTAGDIVDRAGSGGPASLTGVAIVDDATRCLWLVNVSGADSGARHLVAWPSATEVDWDPFRLVLPQPSPDDLILESDRLAVEGEFFADLSELDDTDRVRLLGLDGCPHEAVLVITDRPGSVLLDR